MRKGIAIFILIFTMSACAGTALSEFSQKWLTEYEAVVDEYLAYVDAQTADGEQDVQMSEGLQQKLNKLAKDAEEIRAELKPGEGMAFFKEFGRITSKMSIQRVKKKVE